MRSSSQCESSRIGEGAAVGDGITVGEVVSDRVGALVGLAVAAVVTIGVAVATWVDQGVAVGAPGLGLATGASEHALTIASATVARTDDRRELIPG